MLLTIVIFLVVLSILVLVHEFGHFIAARKFGAGVEEFGLGFPPRLCGIYKNTSGVWKFVWWNREVKDAAGTIYSLNLIPLGGFVKIDGENGEDKDSPQSFAHKPIWQRAIMLSAGVIMNVLLAAIFISANFMIGAPQAIDGSDLSGAIVSNRRIQVMEVLPDSPALKAGLKGGDEIVSVNDQSFATYSQLQAYVGDKAGQPLQYTIRRGQSVEDKTIIPEVMASTSRAGIGISIAEVASVRYPWYAALWEGIKTTGLLIVSIFIGFYQLIAKIVSGGGVGSDVAGPVGIAVLTGQVVDLGFSYVLQFAALLSLNLAVINFLPFPALDGGRVLFLIIEKI